jgi:hypothetical protein
MIPAIHRILGALAAVAIAWEEALLAGVTLFESTTSSSTAKPFLLGVKSFETTGFSCLKFNSYLCSLFRWLRS